MPEESLHKILDAMRQRIQAELDAQISSLVARHDEVVTRARQDAEAEVEKRWASKVDVVRAEWSARLQSEVAGARADAEKRLVAEAMRVRTEAEEALSSERQRAAAELDAERRRSSNEMKQTLATLDAERAQLEPRASTKQANVDPATVLGTTRAIGRARLLSDALGHLVRGAAAHAPRVGLFVVNGSHLDEWTVAGAPRISQEPVPLENSGLLRAAVTRGVMVSADAGSERTPPAFAALRPGAAAVAMPLMLDGQAVAVLYADGGMSGGERTQDSWAEAIELLGSHAASCLAHLTAVRSLQVAQLGNANEPPATTEPDDDHRAARRYAKLLVSEIKLYNEGAVRVGCEKRDLLHRLREEIDRARRLYEQRVPTSFTGRDSYFQHELVHTLAGGDPLALGPATAVPDKAR